MNNINFNFVSESRTRLLKFMIACLLLTVGFYPNRDFTASATAGIQKLHHLQHQAREAVRLSARMYRFYKLTSEKPVLQASMN